MITGFNTDVRHEGHVYHVQTEDRGKDHPILESLVYVGGTIVAKKLTPYPEPSNDGAGPEALASLLKRQHQVIIAAIKAGRIQDLIRHSSKQPEKEQRETPPAEKLAQPQSEVSTEKDERTSIPQAPPVIGEPLVEPRASNPADALAPASTGSSIPGRSSRQGGSSEGNARASSYHGDATGLNLDQVLEDYAKRGSGQAKLDVKVLTPKLFVAGSGVGLRVQVTNDGRPDFQATVTVKIIGTAFKPQVFIGRVGKDGVANFSLTLPSFSTGTAAIVIEAQSGAGRGELKNLIRRA
jgi:hypothetical protein